MEVQYKFYLESSFKILTQKTIKTFQRHHSLWKNHEVKAVKYRLWFSNLTMSQIGVCFLLCHLVNHLHLAYQV